MKMDMEQLLKDVPRANSELRCGQWRETSSKG